jgi:formamidopyrimidine-DNA glycosylase
MPELPEVETTRRGIEPHLVGKSVREILVHRGDLRQPVPASLAEIEGLEVTRVTRRAKYLIISLVRRHHVIIHLGMSGSLRVVDPATEFRRHDHIALTLSSGKQLRYHDPRRFGIFTHFVCNDPLTHPLFKGLGPEPLLEEFNVEYLHNALQKTTRPVKVAIMDNALVVGVGNIYASEALYHAGIHPTKCAAEISKIMVGRLIESMRDVLEKSIAQGGTTLRDFLRENGEPGYFRQMLFVYDRADQSCRVCEVPIVKIIQAQRASFYCPQCQQL